MISAGEVGAAFVIVDEASAKLKLIADQLYRLDAALLRTKEGLASFGATSFAGLSGRINGVAKSLTTLDASTAKAAESFALLEGKITRSTDVIATELGKTSEAFALVDSAAGSSADAVAADFARMDRSIIDTRMGLAGLSRDMAEIGAAGAVAGGGGAGRMIGGGLGLPAGGGAGGGSGGDHGGGGSGPNFHTESVPVAPGVRAGFGHSGMAVGGVAAGFLGYEAFKYAAELADAQERLVIGGVSRDNIAKATALSYQLSEKFGQPVTSVLDTINEIRNPLGGIDPAMEHIQRLGSAMVVLRAADVKNGGRRTADDLYNLVKSAEFRNSVNGETFDKAIDAMVRADVATGGRVGPSEFVQMSKYMRAALPGLTDNFLYTYAPELAQEFKGSSAGTTLASLYQQVVAGQMRSTGLQLLDDLGEIDHSLDKFGKSRVTLDKEGRVVKVRPGAINYAKTLKADPAEGIAQQISDMEKHGIKEEGDQRDWFTQIYGNRSAAQMAMTLGYQWRRLHRGAAGINMTEHTDDAAQELLTNDPATNMKSLSSSWENLMASAGTSLVPPVTTFFKNMTTLMNALGEASRGDWSSNFWKNPYAGTGIFKAAPPAPYQADIGLPAAQDLAARNYADRNRNQVWDTPEARRGAVMSSPQFAAAQKPADVHATLQATVNTTVPFTVNVDGQAVANAIMPKIIQMIQSEMHSAMSGLEGMVNDVAHRLSPGMHN